MKPIDRRAFLKGSAALSGGLVAARAAALGDAAAPGAKKPLKIGLMTYNIARTWDLDTIIRNCVQAGFRHVELRTTHAHKVEVDLSAARRAEVRRKLEDSPIEAWSLASGFSYHHADPAVLRRHIEGTKAYTSLARDIGARGIRVFPGRLPAGPGIPEERTLEQIGRALREVGSFAADHGVRIRVSNHGRGTNRIPVIRKILDRAGGDVSMNWNCDPSDVTGRGLEANFRLVAGRIDNIHMHELVGGGYPYPELFRLLREAGYEGYCDMEIGESGDAVRLMKYYRALFLAYQGIFS